MSLRNSINRLAVLRHRIVCSQSLFAQSKVSTSSLFHVNKCQLPSLVQARHLHNHHPYATPSVATVTPKHVDIGQLPVSLVTRPDVMEMIAKHRGVIIDVRNENELKETGRIGNAINIPNNTLGDVFDMSNKAFADLVHAEKPSLDELIVCYCRSGVRAGQATLTLAGKGFTNVKLYAGSWNDWSNNNNNNNNKDSGNH